MHHHRHTAERASGPGLFARTRTFWEFVGGHHRGHREGRGSHRGFGHFGDGDGLTRGRKFTSDDLQLLLLALLATKPAHGYELIKSLEILSNGFYSPSPGMIYPALTYLEELGYVTVAQEGNRKAYQIDTQGRAYLASNRERADRMLARLDHIGRKMDSVRRAFAGEAGAAGVEGAEADSGWLPEFIEARRAMKNALYRSSEPSAAEQRRLAAILRDATRRILGD